MGIPCLSIYVLAAAARNAGHPTTLLDPCKYTKLIRKEDYLECCVQLLLQKIEESGAEAIGFSANTFLWPEVRLLTKLLKERRPEIQILIGGMHPTLFPEHTLRISGADVVIRGEGEHTLPKVLDALERGQELSLVPGITYRTKEGICSNPDAPELTLEEMEAEPYPAYDLIPEANPYRMIPVESSRGCMYSCAFCSIPHRHNWRGLSEKTVGKRMEYALRYQKQLQMGDIFLFVDDCFSADGERATAILQYMGSLNEGRQKAYLEFRFTDVLRTPILQRIEPGQIFTIQFGVECGYEEGLLRIKKGLTMKQLFAGLDLLKACHLEEVSFLSFIIGFPWETREEVFKTIDTIEEIVANYRVICNLNWLIFLPSDLWKEREQYGIDVDESVFDETFWNSNPDVFFRTHPRIQRQDVLDVDERIRNICYRKHYRGQLAYRRAFLLDEERS